MSQQRRRYPGLNYFTTEQKDQFFGRDAEKEDLLALVQTEKIVALFGKSGYGKSSLIRAGLIPILPPNVLPIIVNFGAYQKGQSVSLLQKTLDNLNLALSENVAEMDFLNAPAPSVGVTLSHADTHTLWHHFKQKQSAAPRPFLLIFDQFEEFDSYPPEQRAAFKQQLAELLYTRIPQALRDLSDALTDEQQALLARPLEVRALFAIREDRLSVLDALADRLPEILYKRFHLRGLADSQAVAAVVEPALLAGGQFESPRFRYTPEAVAAILRGLKKDDSEALVESFLLQICCEEIERSVIGRRETEPTVTAAELPVFRDLFEQYYRNKIAALPDEATRRAARRMIEDQLVAADPATGIAYRVNVDGRTLLALPGVDDTLLRRLTDAFLLRSEPNTTGGFSYEVSHDRLVEGIWHLRMEREEAERIKKLVEEKVRIDEEKSAAKIEEGTVLRRAAKWTSVFIGTLAFIYFTFGKEALFAIATSDLLIVCILILPFYLASQVVSLQKEVLKLKNEKKNID
ncbi:MAG: ATP-binding protein [Saprospiraceae bacterium]